jgi:general secretion pathway protein A
VSGQAFAAGAGDRIDGGSKALVDALNRFLLQVHAQGGQAVLVIDEAQALSAEVLEQLRLLTNLETSERKLLQIVLIGQPELRAMVASPGLEQLAQRVIARYHLGPLSAPDTARYVQHRLAVAGLSGPLPFDAAALKRVHERSRGVPRRINLLCDRALLGAYATGRRSVDAGIVERAAAEVAGEPLPAEAAWWGAPGSLRRTAWLAAGGLVLTLGAAALASALMRQT